MTNYEVMDVSKNHVKRMDTVQNTLGRLLLGLPPCTPAAVTLGELGWTPISMVIAKRKMLYLRYLIKNEMDEPERLIVHALKQQIAWHEQKPHQKSWYKEMLQLVAEYDVKPTGVNSLEDMSDIRFKQLFHARRKSHFIVEMMKKPSLQYYRDKRNPGLDLTTRNHGPSNLWLRCRTGTLQLGWKQGLGLCPACRRENTNETIAHFLWECKGNRDSELKETTIAAIEAYMPDFVLEGDAQVKTFWTLALHQTQGMRMIIGEMIAELWKQRGEMIAVGDMLTGVTGES